MSDRAATKIRAYPMPAATELDRSLREQLQEQPCEVFALDGVGLVLAIDTEEATDGIASYNDLIVQLHEAGLNVVAENHCDQHSIRARREFWPAGRDGYGWLIDPFTLAPLLPISDPDAAQTATARAQELLALIGEIPTGLLDTCPDPIPYFDRAAAGREQ